jgi:uncharacterized alkaline shock family protein YloU
MRPTPSSTPQRHKRSASGAPVGGALVVSDKAIADLVGFTVLECYGIVGMASPNLRQGVASLLSKDRIRQGIKVTQGGDEVHIKLYVIIEYGLNVAEVAGNVRSQVAYNVQKMLGRPATTLRIYVQGVRVGDH